MSRNMIGLLLVGLVVFVVANSVYILNEYQRGVVTRFGAMINDDVSPGLHFKWPIADTVHRFDGRVLTIDAEEESFFIAGNKRLMVNAFVKWRVAEADTFYRATSGRAGAPEEAGARLLFSRVADGLRNEFGERTLYQVVSGDRDQLMETLTERLNTIAMRDLGVQVVDIRIKRIDLPVEVSQSVFERMEADREKEAAEYRAIGHEQAEVIRADADRQRAVLEANAFRESELIRGDGDARAAAIYAEAFNQDPEFYAFVRSLNAYRNTFAGKEDLLVVDPGSDFFRYLKSSTGER